MRRIYYTFVAITDYADTTPQIIERFAKELPDGTFLIDGFDTPITAYEFGQEYSENPYETVHKWLASQIIRQAELRKEHALLLQRAELALQRNAEIGRGVNAVLDWYAKYDHDPFD